MLTPHEQHLKIAAIQRRWSTLAKKEGQGNLRSSRRYYAHGQNVLGRALAQEANLDFQFARKRLRIARKNEMM